MSTPVNVYTADPQAETVVETVATEVPFSATLTAPDSLLITIDSAANSDSQQCWPRSELSSCSLTIQSQSSAEVPLEAVQSVLPSTPSFLTNV